MRALILAGGRGERLGSLTRDIPKPLLPLGKDTPLSLLISALLQSGVDDITLALGYRAESIIAYIRDSPALASRARYHFIAESTPRGTAGPLRDLPEASESFLVCNGDVVTSLDFHALWTHHHASGAALTIATQAQVVPIRYGVLELAADGTLTEYREKPQLRVNISLGVYAVSPRVPKYIQHGEALDVPALLARLLGAGERVDAWATDAYWLDIGTAADYARACRKFALADPSSAASGAMADE